MTIRFDADKDRVVDGLHVYDKAERDVDVADMLWYLTENQSNGRWLFVGAPHADGRVPLGILRVYTKYLSPAALRSFASACIEAADKGEAIQARNEVERAAQAERQRQCAADGGHRWRPWSGTGHAAGVLHSDGTSQSWVECTRCEATQLLDGDAYDAAMRIWRGEP